MINTRGITLIALIITIIVLVILAGISIASLTGQNGILNQAGKAKEDTQRETAKEKVQIAVMGSYGTDGKLNYEQLKENLEKIEGIKEVPNTITKESFPLIVQVDDYQVTIEETGNVTVEKKEAGDMLSPQEPITIEQAKEKGEALDKKNPVTIQDKYENKIVVPEGFKIAKDSAQEVTGGVVIEDASNPETLGSQFVWIPVGEVKGENGDIKTIELNRYTFAENGTPTSQGDHIIENYYQELTSSGIATAKDLEEFKTSVAQNGGYYIGRYEAGDPFATENRTATSTHTLTAVCKQGQYVYNYVTQAQASTLSRNMYKDAKFTSDLTNSYAWDTAIVFIQEFSGDTDYSKQTKLQGGTLPAKTGEATDGTNKDVKCNIYDMAGNTVEWTTETYYIDDDFWCVDRGGRFDISNAFTSCRDFFSTDLTANVVSFRIILYV